MKTDEIRAKYLDFFSRRGHRLVESDSLVPAEDPTVLFTPAGMNQFKKQFMGCLTGFSRAASAQRCLRTDDLEKVGKTDCHHTFFEMLGNFSFGDYFKKDAINWAWEFLTAELRIDHAKLSVSVHKDDDEAYRIWKEDVRVPEARIARLGDKDNFWPADAREKGPNGPCGPCSEIFFDMGAAGFACSSPDCGPGCGCGRYVEIWNLVFTQFNRREGGILEPLPQKNIDTGMGLERISAVMQGVRSNFETDAFSPLVDAIKAGCPVGGPAVAASEVYAVADHLRAAVFAIYDGILPSNEARGYVVRKLIRKSVLHLRGIGINGLFLHTLVPVAARAMRLPYPELVERAAGIEAVISAEERSFQATLSNSETMLEAKLGSFRSSPDAHRAGIAAFQLYDTYGIPFELTSSWAAGQGIKLSAGSFEKEMELQKNRSKAGSAMQGDVFCLEQTWQKGLPATEFLGYTSYEAQGRVLKIIAGDDEIEEAGQGSRVRVVLDRSVFYAESGGQCGDTGTIKGAGAQVQVIDTKKIDKIIMHDCRVISGVLRKGEDVLCALDKERRLNVARNHTATHLLQAALRLVLGPQVRQQGSMVAEDRLRFDFANPSALSREELDKVEALVNSFVLENPALEKREMTLEEAKSEGALAFFAEKYAEKVRVITVPGISKELCGGTHLDFAGQIGQFRILQESSVAQGVRRIEAVTGSAAYALAKEEETVISSAAEALGVPANALVTEAQKKASRIRDLEKELSALRMENARSSALKLLDSAQKINKFKLVSGMIPDADPDVLRRAVDSLKKESPLATLFALGSVKGGRAFLVLGATQDLCAGGFKVSGMIGEVAALIGGSGGGRADFAQAGGSRPDKIEEALLKFRELAERAEI
ncbi:MAG: alanine--tRNA ligase [Candidatus Omnitrophica bacterium]|nr:alanine--tRNA ligase [Candidatus Omnitrophota bacterium]